MAIHINKTYLQSQQAAKSSTSQRKSGPKRNRSHMIFQIELRKVSAIVFLPRTLVKTELVSYAGFTVPLKTQSLRWLVSKMKRKLKTSDSGDRKQNHV